MSYMKEFGQVLLELSKEDIKKHPERPVLRMIDDDVQFVQKEIARNRENWLDTWNDYVG